MSDISHPGIIENIDGNLLKVSFTAHGACASCVSKTLCQMSEHTDKIAQVRVAQPEHYHIGQEVELYFSSHQGLFSVFIAYILPALVLIATLFTTTLCGGSEAMSGLLALACTALYYLALIPARKRIKQRLDISVRAL